MFLIQSSTCVFVPTLSRWGSPLVSIPEFLFRPHTWKAFTLNTGRSKILGGTKEHLHNLFGVSQPFENDLCLHWPLVPHRVDLRCLYSSGEESLHLRTTIEFRCRMKTFVSWTSLFLVKWLILHWRSHYEKFSPTHPAENLRFRIHVYL